MKRIRIILIIPSILIMISTLLISYPLEVSAYKTFNSLNYLGKERLVKNGDGGFDYSSNIDDIIRLDMVSCYIDSIIIVDFNKADSIWKSKGDTISEEYEGRNMILIEDSNLPYEYDFEKSPERERLTSNYASYKFTEKPSEMLMKKSDRRFLKKERNSVNIDYAICNDSLIICVYHSVLDMSGKHGRRRYVDHINFIHKYNCEKNDWKLSDINDNIVYFPGCYKTDILRNFTNVDLKSFIMTHYNHKRWSEMNTFNRNYSLSDLYDETYIKNSDFPIGALCGITDSLYRLPNNFSGLKKVNSFFKSPKTVIGAEYKLKGDSLIICFSNHTYVSKKIYTDKKNRVINTGHGDFGFFVYQYDCVAHKWKKISEDFLVSKNESLYVQ